MPLLPFGETFHSSVSSKFLNFSVVMISAAGRTRVSAPSLTPHPDGIVSICHPRRGDCGQRQCETARERSHQPCVCHGVSPVGTVFNTTTRTRNRKFKRR